MPHSKPKTADVLVFDRVRELVQAQAVGFHGFAVEAQGLELEVTIKLRRKVDVQALFEEVTEYVKNQPWMIHSGKCDSYTTKKSKWSSRAETCTKSINGVVVAKDATNNYGFHFACSAHCAKHERYLSSTPRSNGSRTEFLANIPLSSAHVKKLVAIQDAYTEKQRLLSLARPFAH